MPFVLCNLRLIKACFASFNPIHVITIVLALFKIAELNKNSSISSLGGLPWEILLELV